MTFRKRKKNDFSSTWKNRCDFFVPVLLFISLAALAFRLIAGFQLLANDPFAFDPAAETDMATYRDFAVKILNGKFPDEFYYQPFYYAVFLPLTQIFTGPCPGIVVFFQALSGAFAVWFTGYSGAMLAGRKAGIAAAVLAAFSFLAILYTPYFLIASIQLFNFTLLLYLVLRAWKRGTVLLWGLAGTILSIAILTRGNAWCFLPPILIAFYFGEKKRKTSSKRKWILLGVLIAGIVLPQMPFAAVNSLKQGTLCGPSTAGSAVLALGNTPESPPGTLEYPMAFELWTKHQNERSVPMRILDWAASEPLAFVELYCRKVFLFWNYEEIPNNIIPERSAEKSALLSRLPTFPTYVPMTLALAAVLLAVFRYRTKKQGLLIAVLFVIFYNFATAAFYILARFRVPSIGFFCVLAAFFLADAWNMRKKRILLRHHALALGTAILIVGPGFGFYRTYYEDAVMRLARPDGVKLALPGNGMMYCDNGPNGLGGWNAAKNSVFIKTFAAKDIPRGTKVKIQLPLYQEARTGNPVEISVNGKKFNMESNAAKFITEHTLEVPYPEDGKFHIELVSKDGESTFLLDTQRNYGRTLGEDGKKLYAELVVRLIREGN